MPADQSDPVLTAEGRAMLAERAERLRREVLPELRVLLPDPNRDPTVDADYHRALIELDRIEATLASARHVESTPGDPTTVLLGDLVTVEVAPGEQEQFLVVDPTEAPLDEQRISAQSPLARAILGRSVGEEVEVRSPRGSYRVKILAADRPATAQPA
jgi:transcription elongation factor GreA